MLADDTILKLGFSLSNDLRRVVPALRAAAAGETEPAVTPPGAPEPQPEPEDATHTPDDSGSDGSASDESDCGGIDDNGDEIGEAGAEPWDQAGELSEAAGSVMLGPEDVARELDQMGCLDGDSPAADQLFNPEAAGSPSSGASARQVKTILLMLTPAPVGPAVRALAPSVVACVLGQERRLQLGRCASALGCPRSSLSLIPASELVSVCGFPRGAIGPVGLRADSVGQPPRVLMDEELMPAVLPAFSPDAAATSAGSSDTPAIVSADLEAATILCGAGRADLVFRVRPRQLLQALGDRGSVALIHAEGARQPDEPISSFQPMGRARRKQRGNAAAGRAEDVIARHALDLQAAVGQMIPLRAADGKQRTYSGQYTSNADLSLSLSLSLSALCPSLSPPLLLHSPSQCFTYMHVCHGAGARKYGPIPSPGLADTVLQLLGFELDKGLQCSSWGDRPLSEAQLRWLLCSTYIPRNVDGHSSYVCYTFICAIIAL